MPAPWRSAVLIQVRKVQTLQCKCMPTATNAPWSVRDRQIYEDVEVPLEQSTNRRFRMALSCFGEPNSLAAWDARCSGFKPQAFIQPMFYPLRPLPSAQSTSYQL